MEVWLVGQCSKTLKFGQSKHRRLYITSALSPHTFPNSNCHTLTQCKICQLIGRVGLPGVPTPHFAFKTFADATTANWSCRPQFCIYPMHFTRYSVQGHLRNFKTKYSRLLLHYSTGNEQWPRIWTRFEYYQ